MTRLHLHQDDFPHSLAILRTLFTGRLGRAAAIGFEPTDAGAWVDWNRLTDSWLSSTETAAVHIARGIATLEWHGPIPDRLRRPTVNALDAVAGVNTTRDHLHRLAVTPPAIRRRTPATGLPPITDHNSAVER